MTFTIHLWQSVTSLVYQRRPGRQYKLTKTQHKKPSDLIKIVLKEMDYRSGCWSATLI
jgi:hypothetical protein